MWGGARSQKAGVCAIPGEAQPIRRSCRVRSSIGPFSRLGKSPHLNLRSPLLRQLPTPASTLDKRQLTKSPLRLKDVREMAPDAFASYSFVAVC